MNRKTFLKRCAALAAGTLCLDLAGCASVPYASFTTDGSEVLVSPADLEPAGYALLKVDTLPAPVFIARHNDGTYSAVLLKCTHRGCTVQPAGKILQCPCHGSQYTHTGQVVRGPAPQNLPAFPISAGTGHLRIDLTVEG